VAVAVYEPTFFAVAAVAGVRNHMTAAATSMHATMIAHRRRNTLR
jgi:hypothetical protein